MIGTQFDGLGEGPLHMVPQGMKLSTEGLGQNGLQWNVNGSTH